MKKYKVQLRGENFLLNLNGDLQKYGFNTTRIVKAKDPQEAERHAIILTHQNSLLRDTMKNESMDRPHIKMLDIQEVGFFNFLSKRSNPVLNFFSEDDPCDII